MYKAMQTAKKPIIKKNSPKLTLSSHSFKYLAGAPMIQKISLILYFPCKNDRQL